MSHLMAETHQTGKQKSVISCPIPLLQRQDYECAIFLQIKNKGKDAYADSQ
jgi:hypothetical protein